MYTFSFNENLAITNHHEQIKHIAEHINKYNISFVSYEYYNVMRKRIIESVSYRIHVTAHAHISIRLLAMSDHMTLWSSTLSAEVAVM